MTARLELSRLYVCCLIVMLLTAVLPRTVTAGITPAANDFGVRYVLGAPVSTTFTIPNSGTSPLSVTSISLSGTEAADYSVTGHTCQNPIPAAGGCTVDVAFVPQSAGLRAAQLDATTDDPANPALSATLLGTGIMQRYLLSLSLLGDGSGTVHSSPGVDISCSATTCTEWYDTGATVTLTPYPATESLFAGWSGCNNVSNGVCSVSVNMAKYVSATFVRDKSLLNYRWESRGPDGGVVNQFAFSPDASTIFAATSGGVFVSTNGGASWTSANAGLSGFDVRGIALSPGFATDSTLFAATSAGLFVSNNAGNSWMPAGSGISGFDITSVVVSPAFASGVPVSDSTLFAGTTSGVYRSSDAGATWVPVPTGLTSQAVRAMAVSPLINSGYTVFAATAGGVFRSDNRGDNWSLIGTLLNNVNVLSIALSPNFALDGAVFAGTDSSGAFRFDPGTEEWSPLASIGNNQPVVSLALSPSYGIDLKLLAGTSNGLYMSTDAGSSWLQRDVINWGSRFFGSVAFLPIDSAARTIYVGSRGGGVSYSNDGGAFWFSRSSGLSAVKVRKVVYSPDFANDGTAFAASLGGIHRTVDSGGSWGSVNNGIDAVDMAALALSPAFAVDRTLFAAGDGGVYRSIDGGLNWTRVKSGISASAIAVSPSYLADNSLYVATTASQVFRSQDGGASWLSVSTGLTGRSIFDLAITPSGAVFAATDNGVYFLGSDGWQPLTAGRVTGGDKKANGLAVSPNFASDNTIYIATDGYGVLVTRDSGVTWGTANLNLTDLHVQSLALTPDFSTSHTLFAATAGGGIFRSTSVGEKWVPYNNELSNQDVATVSVSPDYAAHRQVLAGSNGSGIFRLLIIEPQITPSPSAVDFGTVALTGSSGNRTITLSNTSLVDLRVAGISLSGVAVTDFNLRPGSCPTVFPFIIHSGESCTVMVSFDPLTVPGSRAAAIAIESDATANPLINLPLTGNAYDPPPFGTISISAANGSKLLTISPDVTLNLNAIDNSGVVASMQFSNDNLAWSPPRIYAASTPWTLSTLGGDGIKTVYVQFIDGAGNVSESFQASIRLDSTPPVTTITSMPAIHYNNPDGKFEFVSNKSSSTFTCRIGMTPAVSCESPFSFTGLADGPYTISIIAIDSVGNVGPAATYSWTIDTIQPDTLLPTAPTALTNSATAAFVFGSTETGATFQCKLDNGPWAPCPNPYTLTEVPDGGHTLLIQAKDLAGNLDPTPYSFSWTVDTRPPVTTIVSKPANPTNQTSGSITFSASEPVANQDCTLDGVVTTGCSSPFAFSGLGEGNHTFAVRSRDLAGNPEATAASYSWRVDLTPPVTSITVKPLMVTNLTTASFTFVSSEPGSTFECGLDGAPLLACSNPLTLSGLSDGLHHLAVRAVDPAGNPDNTTTVYDWTVDTIAPDTTILTAPANPSATVASSFTFSSSESGSTFQCRIDGGVWSACSSVASFSLFNGPHTFEVRAVDSAGNIDQTPATFSWTINIVSTQSVKVVSSGQPDAFFNGISDALTSYPASSSPTFMLKVIDFIDNVVVNRCGETVRLTGGYNNDFTVINGTTPIYGSLTVVCGTVIVDGVEIR